MNTTYAHYLNSLSDDQLREEALQWFDKAFLDSLYQDDAFDRPELIDMILGVEEAVTLAGAL